MTDFVFNSAKGKVAYYAGLPAANDALIAIPLQTTGLEAIGTLRDYDDVAALLAGTTDEQTTMGRKTLTGVVVTPDDVNDRLDVDCDDIVWTAPTGSAVSMILVAYNPNVGSGTDANLIPLVALDFVVTPTGNDLTYVVATGGFYRAA